MKRYLIILMFLLTPVVFAADSEVQDLTEDTNPTTDDVLYTVDDPSGTPASRKATIANVLSNKNVWETMQVISENSTTADSATDIFNFDRASGISVTISGDTITIGNSNPGNFTWVIRPQQMKLPSSNPMGIDAGNNRWRGLFDASTREFASHETALRPFPNGSTLQAKVLYTAVSATTGTAAFGISIDCKSDADAVDFDTESYGTIDTLSGTVNGTAGRLDVLNDTSLNEDSCAQDDHITVAVERDTITDSASGDLELRAVIVYVD